MHRINSPAEPEFNHLIAIYRASLPISEQKSSEALAAMVQSSGYFFLVAKQQDSVVGFSISLCFHQSNACLLEYMAVSPAHRGQGIGASLFMYTAKTGEIAQRYMLAEVDLDKALSHSRSDESRRKMFYRRLGCREVEGLSYIMPPVSATVQPPAMELLVFKPGLPRFVTKSCLRSWLQSAYTQVYHQAADDSRIDSMVRELPDKIRLL